DGADEKRRISAPPLAAPPGHTVGTAAFSTGGGEGMILLVILISVLSLAFAWYLARQVLAADEGTPEMQSIASAIKEGAEAFLRRQNRTILVIGLGVAVPIFLLFARVRPPPPHAPAAPMHMAAAGP